MDSPITIFKGWILQTAQHSNNFPALRDRTVYKLKVFKLCFALHVQAQLPANLSDPDAHDAGSETEDNPSQEPAKSWDSLPDSDGQPFPLKSSKAKGQSGEATEEDFKFTFKCQ